MPSSEVFRSLTAQQQKFIFHFLREGGVEENIWVAEKKSRLPKGEGVRLYKLKHVRAEIDRRKAQVELEEAKQIARDKSGLAREEDTRQKVTLDKVEAKLDSLLALDPKTHGSLVLATIQTALVYTGTIRSGKMERMLPPPDPEGKDGAGTATGNFYDSIFDPMRAKQDLTAPAPLMPEDAPKTSPAPKAPVPPAATPKAAPAGPEAKPAKYSVTIT